MEERLEQNHRKWTTPLDEAGTTPYISYRGNRRGTVRGADMTGFVDTTFTLAELMELTEEDMDQLEALHGEIEGTALWWALWRAERER